MYTVLMDLIAKYLKKNSFLLFLILLFFISRLANITVLPAFNDEAVHVDWGYKELHGKGLFFSLYDAKQPLLMWLFGFSQLIFADPLFAGRLVSTLFGLATLVGLYQLGAKTISSKAGLYAAGVYLVTPLFFFFDRQALMEGPLVACAIWTVVLYLQLKKTGSVSTAIILGCVLGVAFFIKTTALFFLLALLAVYAVERWILPTAHPAPFPALFILAGAVSQLVLMPLYFQPLFWHTLGRTAERSLGIREVVGFPVVQWGTTALAVGSIAWWHFTPVLFVLGVVGIFTFAKKKLPVTKSVLSVVVYMGTLLLLYILTARSTPVRYVVPVLWWWPMSVAAGLMWLERYRWVWRGAVISLCVPLGMIILLIAHPLAYFSLLAQVTVYAQKDEYVTHWPAGYGVREALEVVRTELKGAPGVVAVRADAGNPESSVFMYLNGDPELQPLFLDTTIAPLLTNYECVATNRPLYFVSRDTQLGGMERFMIEKARIHKPEQQSFLGLYTLRQCTSTQKVLTLEFE